MSKSGDNATPTHPIPEGLNGTVRRSPLRRREQGQPSVQAVSPLRQQRLEAQSGERVLFRNYVLPFVSPANKRSVFHPNGFSGVIYDQEASGLGLFAERVLRITKLSQGSEDSFILSQANTHNRQIAASTDHSKHKSQNIKLGRSIDKPFEQLIDKVKELTYIKKSRIDQKEEQIRDGVLRAYKGWRRGFISPKYRCAESSGMSKTKSEDFSSAQRINLGWRLQEKIVDGTSKQKRNPVLETLSFGKAHRFQLPPRLKQNPDIPTRRNFFRTQQLNLSGSPSNRVISRTCIS